MARRILPTLIVLAAAFAGLAAAQQTTTNTRFEGFTYVSSVIGYVNMSLDYCDIQAAINANNFTRALDIYATGKNSFSGLSRRSFSRFATLTSAPGAPEPIHDALAMGRNATWLDAMIRDALAQRQSTLALGLMQVAASKYGLHEIDEAHMKLEAYLKEPVGNDILISDASGAAHGVDEAWALWSAGSATACAAPSRWASRFAAQMATTFAGRSILNMAVENVFNELLATSRNGTVSLASYNASRYQLQQYLGVMGLQGVALSIYRTQAAVNCKRPAAEIADAKATILVHWAYLQPILVARGASTTIVSNLEAQVRASTISHKNALPAIRAAATALGVQPAEIGTPQFGVITAGWTQCRPAVMNRRLMM